MTYRLPPELRTKPHQKAIDMNNSIDFARHVFREHTAELARQKDRQNSLGAAAIVALVLWFLVLVYLML